MKKITLSTAFYVLFSIFSPAITSAAIGELGLRRQGIYFYDEDPNSQACTQSSSTSSSSLPLNIPDPLRTILNEAAKAYNTDVILLATIFADEQDLYNNNAYKGTDWKTNNVNSNTWAASNAAKGPFQFTDPTWNEQKEEGPFVYDSVKSVWTTNFGPADTLDVNQIDDAAFSAAKYISSFGGVNGVALGSANEDFSRNNATGPTVANILKSYNAGKGTWKENGIWTRIVQGTPSPWPGTAKQTEITNYIRNGLMIYSNLASISGGGIGCNGIALGNINIIDMIATSNGLPEPQYLGFHQGSMPKIVTDVNGQSVATPSAIALHWTGGNPNIDGNQFYPTIAHNKPPNYCCSVQFFVNGSGNIYQLTPENQITWHLNSWNDSTIGIEIGGGSDGTIATAKRELLSNPIQQTAVTQLVMYLMNKFNIPPTASIPSSCSVGRPVGLIGHIDYPCNGGKVDPSREYLELIRTRVAR